MARTVAGEAVKRRTKSGHQAPVSSWAGDSEGSQAKDNHIGMKAWMDKSSSMKVKLRPVMDESNGTKAGHCGQCSMD